MSDDSILINHDVVGTTTGKLLDQQENLLEESFSFKEALAALESSWQGSASSNFQATGMLVGDDFDFVITYIGSISGKLTAADAQFVGMDAVMAATISGGK